MSVLRKDIFYHGAAVMPDDDTVTYAITWLVDGVEVA